MQKCPPSDETAKAEYSILVLDDDPMDIKLLQLKLKKCQEFKTRLHSATELSLALEILEREHVDLILLDYYLGPIHGDQAMTDIRAAGYHLPMIIMSGHGNEHVAIDSFHAGAMDYLIKGDVTPTAMGRTIANAHEKFHLRQTLEKKTTSLELANQGLLQKTAEIQTFYHTLSHELKTPLSAANEFLAICLDGIAGALTADQEEYLTIAKDSCMVMNLYINDMLDVTRLETGKLSLSLNRTLLGDVVNSAVKTFKTKAKGLDLTLTCEVEEGLGEIRLDRNRIIQVMTNLLSNACKFTPPGGSIVVRVYLDKCETDFQKVEVEDTGPGIKPEFQEKVFQRLFQVRGGDEVSKSGLGLGLNLCQGLVALHGGSIKVTGAKERGSIFTFSLPIPAEPV